MIYSLFNIFIIIFNFKLLWKVILIFLFKCYKLICLGSNKCNKSIGNIQPTQNNRLHNINTSKFTGKFKY